MTRNLLAATVLLTLAGALHAQTEGPTTTSVLIAASSKSAVHLTPADIRAEVNDRPAEILSLTPVQPASTEVALLLDDGLRTSFARNLDDLRKFLLGLPPSTAVFVGYMQNGRVVPAQNFTTDHARAAEALRLSLATPGIAASPYFSLSEFVKHWPTADREASDNADLAAQTSIPAARSSKSRFVLMITNGVDPYNGSVSPLNQDSPYVDTAIRDAQRAGTPVYSIYYGDAGIRGGAASFSGQSYLSKVAQETGGEAYLQGTGNPISLQPFLRDFQSSLLSTYVATLNVPGTKQLARLKLKSNTKGVKLRAPDQIHPGETDGPTTAPAPAE